MAQDTPRHLSLDTVTRSPSSSSLRSTTTIGSNLSTVSQRRRGLIGRIGNGFNSIFRRFSSAQTSLTEMQVQLLSHRTNFTRDQVLEWHSKFINDYPDGHMTRKQFIAMYKAMCPKVDAERFARHIFRAFDTDRSNTIEFHEFLTGLSMTSPNSSSHDKLEWVFHVFDVNGDGVLTRKECLEIIEVIVRFNQSVQGDTSNTNSDQLLRSAKQSMMNIFTSGRNTHNDKLTMSQFVDGCLHDELISQLLDPKPTTLTNSRDSPTNSS
ncbi:unnamed protein product [Adineta ricciae]|uniref:EF-hand domain-containing protein n=1 Tax=Adineta ricciae TaxID=249248 RepID=A0A814GKH9_ADIRI|nr:unnamed protein product [Adineta ricciae]CAF1129612.1 unnamed protein product [Adineta ricciae]